MSYHIKQWEDIVTWEHKGCQSVTISYDRHSIKPQPIRWKAGVFVTCRGGLAHAGGWNRSFTPKYCLSPSQCFSCSSWCSLLIEKMLLWTSIQRVYWPTGLTLFTWLYTVCLRQLTTVTFGDRNMLVGTLSPLVLRFLFLFNDITDTGKGLRDYLIQMSIS